MHSAFDPRMVVGKRTWIFLCARLKKSLSSSLLFSYRWIYLNDQNLCIPTSSSFVYGAVPIGASIYVIGDLDTGQT